MDNNDKTYKEFLEFTRTTGVQVWVILDNKREDGMMDVANGFILPGEALPEEVTEDADFSYNPLTRQMRRQVTRDRQKNPQYSQRTSVLPRGLRRLKDREEANGNTL